MLHTRKHTQSVVSVSQSHLKVAQGVDSGRVPHSPSRRFMRHRSPHKFLTVPSAPSLSKDIMEVGIPLCTQMAELRHT